MADVNLDDLSVETLSRKTYLKVSQRRELEESIARDEAALRGIGPNGQALPIIPGLPVPDADKIRENLARDKAMLEEGTPPPLTELQSRKRMMRLDELEREITPGMPSIDQMWRPLAPNVDVCIAHSRHNKKKILARRTLLSELDPQNDDPNFRSVELLRTNDPPTVDLRTYWRNSELIKWKSEAELERERPIDEETFHKFCALHGMGWSAKSIKRDLALTDGQYQQAMTRLQEIRAAQQAEDDADTAYPPVEPEPVEVPMPSPSEASAPSSNGHAGPPVYPVLPVDFTVEDLRRVMSLMGLSQRKFAEACGITVAALQTRILKHGRMSDAERLAVLRVYHQFTQKPQAPVEPIEEMDAQAMVGAGAET